jgi:VanZ family protein
LDGRVFLSEKKFTPPETFFILAPLRTLLIRKFTSPAACYNIFMNPLKFRRLWTLIGYGLVILVVVLSLSPSLPSPVDFPSVDKVVHVLTYGVLMLWFAQLHPKSRYVWLAVCFIALGILLEILQSQLDARSGEVWDVAANSLGTVLSWGLALMGVNTLLHQFEDWYRKPGNEN